MPELEIQQLIPPACPLGYTQEQVMQITAERWAEFTTWHYGQTYVICDGRRYDYDRSEIVRTECADAPHGAVIYPWDVACFIRSSEEGK